jgi:hypothetical protein
MLEHRIRAWAVENDVQPVIKLAESTRAERVA